MRRLVYLAITLLFASGTLSCASLGNLCGGFHKPELTFNRVELLDVSLTGITVNVHFNLKNDNPVGVKIASLAYNFEVENRPVVSGHPPNGYEVKPNATVDLAFPAHVNFQDLAATVQVFLQKDVARYSASGSLGVNTPVGVVTFPLSHSGTFDVPKAPDVQINPPTLNSVTLSSAHLTVPILVHNKNGFPLPFGGLSTQVTVGGAPALAPSIPQQSALAPRESRVVNLGVDVNFVQAGMAVANAIRSRQADVGLRGNLNVGGLNVPVDVHKVFQFR
jgi:LEA14-like dessication related protein